MKISVAMAYYNGGTYIEDRWIRYYHNLGKRMK